MEILTCHGIKKRTVVHNNILINKGIKNGIQKKEDLEKIIKK